MTSPSSGGSERGGLSSIGGSLVRVLRTYAGVWYQMVLPLGAVFLAYVAGLIFTVGVMKPLLSAQASSLRTNAGGLTLLMIEVLIPVLFLLCVAGLIWSGATVLVADGVAAGRATSPWRATSRSTRRVPCARRPASSPAPATDVVYET